MYRPCKNCGHRKYKHTTYPLDWPYCKGKNVPKYSVYGRICIEYEMMANLEYLESLVDKNLK